MSGVFTLCFTVSVNSVQESLRRVEKRDKDKKSGLFEARVCQSQTEQDAERTREQTELESLELTITICS